MCVVMYMYSYTDTQVYFKELTDAIMGVGKSKTHSASLQGGNSQTGDDCSFWVEFLLPLGSLGFVLTFEIM